MNDCWLCHMQNTDIFSQQLTKHDFCFLFSLRLCTEIVKHKKNFKSELLRQELECGSLIGSGTMNLVSKLASLLIRIAKSMSYSSGSKSFTQ